MRRIAAGVLLSCLPHTAMRGALATSSTAAALARRSRPSAAPLVRRGAGPAFVAGRGRAPPPPRRALPPPSRGRSSSAPGDARGPAPSLAARKSNDPEGRTDAAGSLLLDPTAPLRPLLAAGVGGENPLAGYALAPTILGTDDFRPELRVGQRVIAFGDVHGDLDALRTFLVAGGLLDPASPSEDPAWTGGDTIVVQTGDVLDRGDDEMACFRLLAALSRRAREAGGALLLLHGNHEALNAAGLFQYANPGGNAEIEDAVGRRLDYNFGSNRWRLQFAGNEPSRWASFEPGGLLAEPLLGNMLVAAVVGRTVFVHAGLRAGHLEGGNRRGPDGEVQEYGGITRLNEQAREWILKTHHGDNNNWGEYKSVEEVVSSAQRRAKVASATMPDCLGGGIGAASPVWMRDYSQPNDRAPKNPRAEEMLVAALQEAGPDVRRMVMGHTPQNRINSALGGKAWRIDVGASKGVMGGKPEVLEIIHGGGADGEDAIHVLTANGTRVEGHKRAVADETVMDFFDMKR